MYIGRLIKPQPFKLVTESRGLRVAYHSVSARSRDPFQQVVRKRKLPCCFVVKPTQKETAPNEPEEEDEYDDEDLPEYIPDPLLNADIDDDIDIKDMDPEKRTTKVIIDLVNAGDSLSKNHHFGSSLIAGGYFEDKLKEYGEYLNEELLEKFFRRIEMAEKYEDPSASEGLKLIWRRVRAEVERKNASPSLRLLDRLLALLHPSSGGTSKERYQSTMGLMVEAFSHSRSQTMNIFELASSISAGEEPPEDLLQELVSRDDFLRELEELIGDADAMTQELQEKRKKILSERAELVTYSKEFKTLSNQLESLDQFIEEREQSLRDVSTLIDIAKAF